MSQVPVTLVLTSHGWPDFYAGAKAGPYDTQYSNSPHTPEFIAEHDQKVASYANKGLVGDLQDLVRMALNLDLNADRFFSELARQQPEMLQKARSVLEGAQTRRSPPAGG